ncbi:MAG: ligand-binding sensor domain-containing protein, partial [Phenylobacterium sp.]
MNSSVSVFSRLPLSFFFTSIIGLLAICYSALSSAQSNIRFDPLAQQAQLSQSTVNALWQDKLGFMWIGTQGGLNRYDGYTMKVFRHDPDDANSLSANWINDIYQDQQGLLWIATERGLD